MASTEINAGILIAHSSVINPERLEAFARRILMDTEEILNEATRVKWQFHFEEPIRLQRDDPHHATDFLEEATLRMVEGPYDMVYVITDVGLVSGKVHVVPGLASPLARIAIISTRKLLMTPRGQALRNIEDESVRWNAAALFLHLMGHLFGLEHSRRGEVMAPFAFNPDLRECPGFSEHNIRRMRRKARRMPERELKSSAIGPSIAFYARSIIEHPLQIISTTLRSRALLLPLYLPGLATAAVAPTFILVFTAEIWDVGLNMSDNVAWSFALASILAATIYLSSAQNLLFPRKDKRILTEHIALVNATVLLILLLAMAGLFIMLSILMLIIEFYVFPPNLIATWPTLDSPEVTVWDKVRLAGFMSTVGVLTGALAGGLESRNLIRHLALFRKEV